MFNLKFSNFIAYTASSFMLRLMTTSHQWVFVGVDTKHKKIVIIQECSQEERLVSVLYE
jgi:hypothetical protein